ncbi:MAG: N-6 DNA methylase [Dehalococcoidia bacterium]
MKKEEVDLNSGDNNGQFSSEAELLAKEICRVAEKATNEEELRIGIEKLLEPTTRKLGILVQPRYEKQIRRSVLTAPGRVDALYGQAIIEYEPPGKLSTQSGLSSTRKQLERYLRGIASTSHQHDAALRRMAGIGLDGYSIFFLRYRGDKAHLSEEKRKKPVSTQLALMEEQPAVGVFSMIGPYPVTAESVSEFLLHLRALKRRPLTADELAKEFGPSGEMAHELVNTLLTRLTACLNTPKDKFPRIKMLYKEWQRILGIVYGQEINKTHKGSQALAKLYHLDDLTDIKPLLFAVHTYYALFMKLLAGELLSLQQGSLLASIAEQLPALNGTLLKKRIEQLEQGSWFEAQGIRNFLEADFFGWYLSGWTSDIESSIRKLARVLAQFEPATATLAPEATRDLLKELYEDLIPRELRHDLGEYSTPDWLAELVLDEVGYVGDPNLRLLDPACGSGTFLILAIRRLLDYARDSLTWRANGDRMLVDYISENIVGFDLNPLAVIAARTNYLLAIGPLVRHMEGKDIPIYLCDSILTPQSQRRHKRPIEHQKDIAVPSTQKDFWIPEELVDNSQVGILCHLIEDCLDSKYSAADFISRCKREIGWKISLTETSLIKLYEKISELKNQDRNGVWTNIIKNSFAPVFCSTSPFDFVIGNPPWINWVNLSDEYREATEKIWKEYGLWPKYVLGAVSDFSKLFTYVAADSYLKKHGRFGFVITQTVFKTTSGAEFRQFKLPDNECLGITKVHDLSKVKPFEGATNRTAVFTFKKGEKINYPVSYMVWRKKKRGSLSSNASLQDILKDVQLDSHVATPVLGKDTPSPWLTAKATIIDSLVKVIGKSEYKSYMGIHSYGANAVYFLSVQDGELNGRLISIKNVTDGARQAYEVQQITKRIEPALVYPLLRGRDVDYWQASPSNHVLVPHYQDGSPIGETELKVEFHETYRYLMGFHDFLCDRSEHKRRGGKGEWYRLFSVYPETFCPWKVVWREQSRFLTCAVVSSLSGKVIIPDHKLMFIPCSSEEEAHYICALLSSVIAQAVIKSCTIETSISTQIQNYVKVPKFDISCDLHRNLSQLSKKAHAHSGHGLDEDIKLIKNEINLRSAELWGLSESNVMEIQKDLENDS